MATVNFPQVFEKLKEEVSELALSTVKSYKDQAMKDALKLIEDMKMDLNRWALQLAEGKLSKTDFEYLVLGQKELIQMNALKQAGLSLIKADEFKNNILNLIVNTVTDLI